MDFTIRQEFQLQVPDFRLYAITGQFKMFNSAMIAGISAIVDPRGPDGDQMRSAYDQRRLTRAEFGQENLDYVPRAEPMDGSEGQGRNDKEGSADRQSCFHGGSAH